MEYVNDSKSFQVYMILRSKYLARRILLSMCEVSNFHIEFC